MKNIILICILFFCSFPLMAQTTVTGKVMDAAGEEVIGATVLQKGTSNGTITNVSGQFTLVLKNEVPAILQISMISYKRQDVDVKGKKEVIVVLAEENFDLEEVVVVGYGTQTKASITGAISNIGNKQLKDVPVSSATNALMGRVSGLVTRQESGRPGGDASKIFIRGRATPNGAEPLVLVDGVERDFSQIDQEDIQSISVLKDASATAVYGVRGANGVILVTTKRGDSGSKPKISLSAEYGVTHFNRIPEQMNAETTSILQREGAINVQRDPSDKASTNNYGTSEYDNYLYRTQLSPFTHPDNDYVDIFTKAGSQQKYNLSISGGNKVVSYFVSVGYFTQDGMFQTDVNELRKHPTFKRLIQESPEVDAALKNPDSYNPGYMYDRLNARSNIDIAITNEIKLGIDMSYRFKKQNRPAAYSIIDANSDGEGMRLFAQFIRNAPQSFPLMNPNGSLSASANRWRQNPLTTMAYTGFRTNYDNELESSFTLKVDLKRLLKGLSTEAKYSFDPDWANWRGMGWRPYVYAYNPANGSYNQGLPGFLPKSDSGRTSPTYKQYAELAFRYKNTFNKKHAVSGVVLGNFRSVSRPFKADSDITKPDNTKYTYIPHVYLGFVGRANYEYDSRYLFEVNMGYNGSNRFAEGHRYQLFPAASVGWVISNEHFMPKNEILTYAKLRGSFGQVGNDNLGPDFSYYYKSTFEDGKGYSFGTNPPVGVSGLTEGRQANMLVTWETATKYNVGFDSKWLHSNLSLNMDFFKERREDILRKLQRYTIFSGVREAMLPPYNIGIVENKGCEFELGWEQRINDFSYYAKAIYSYARNEWIENGESLKLYDYQRTVGHPIDQFFGYEFAGFYNSYDDIASSPQQFGSSAFRPGDMKYIDINGDGYVDTNDQHAIGYSDVPEITYSFQLGAEFKGFDMSIMLQGAAHSSVYLRSDVGWDNTFGSYFEKHLDRWTPETAATATYPRLHGEASGTDPNYYLSDFWLLDGSYLRIKNAQIGYTIPKKILKKTPFASVRFYLTGFNLYTWDKVKILDPEQDPKKNDGYIYPQQKVYNAGVNVTF